MTRRAYVRLRQDIISGELAPGRKLKIEELRRSYDVGTSPIREALSLLTSDHFVERIDQRGFRVSPVSAGEFDELLKTRCWLEERALRESIANGSVQWEEQVVLANYRLSRIPRSQADDRFVANEKWEAQHKLFHMTLIAECGASVLLKFCDQLYDQNVRYRQLSGSKAYPARDIAEEHSAICDAVIARDADVAVNLLMNHYTRTGKYLSEELAD
ncbi:MAG: GntR family transcriptional regulator [Rhizobiaceae bacterium]